MKKLITALAIMVLIFGMASVSAEKIAVKSDIKAYIDYTPIRSYNIDGYTYVIAEELRDYGFSVVWNGEERTLGISRNPLEVPTYTRELYEADTDKVSTSYIIYPTDIVTYSGERRLNSFNIGGRTIIQIDEMAEYGEFIWDAESRQVLVNIFEKELEKIYTDAGNKIDVNLSDEPLEITKYHGQVNAMGEPHGIGKMKTTIMSGAGGVSYTKYAEVTGSFQNGKPCGTVFINMHRGSGKIGASITTKFLGDMETRTDAEKNFGNFSLPYYSLKDYMDNEVFPETNLYKSGLWFEEDGYRGQTGINVRLWYNGKQSKLESTRDGVEFSD